MVKRLCSLVILISLAVAMPCLYAGKGDEKGKEVVEVEQSSGVVTDSQSTAQVGTTNTTGLATQGSLGEDAEDAQEVVNENAQQAVVNYVTQVLNLIKSATPANVWNQVLNHPYVTSGTAIGTAVIAALAVKRSGGISKVVKSLLGMGDEDEEEENKEAEAAK